MSAEPTPSAVGKPEDSTRTIQMSGAAPGVEIGPYKLIRQLGEGGMGVVYHAQQLQPIRRDVALKIIKPGMDSRQVIVRFESERQALAIMDHPNIARVFDAGTTAAGLPFFVMELVDGLPITRYCDAKRLTVDERIELFTPVCRAIQHAHQKGVIHRDIKPSNVLVAGQEGEPVPKVIDFGLAKALGPQMSDATIMTNLGTVVGTLDYMSPEQADPAHRDVDTRSDIYSLGAVLYELLTGTTPLEREQLIKAGYMEALRRIREEEPPPPSTRLRRSTSSAEIAAQRGSDPVRLPKLLHRELDWIVVKALEKDRTRRYETVNGLARDLERYLAGEPVEAAPPSAAYRIGKFVRKHRGWLATAAAITVLVVTGGIMSSWMAVRARRAEQEAQAVKDFLQDDVLAQASARNQSTPGAEPDPDLKVRTALDRAATRIAGKFAGQPHVEASIRFTIGGAYFDLGLYPEAERQVQRAVEIRQRVLGPRHPDTLAAMERLAGIYREQGRYLEAEAAFRTLVEAERRALGAVDPRTLMSMDKLATVYLRQGKFDQAEPLGRDAVDGLLRKLGADSFDTIDAMNDLAAIYTEQGKYDRAEALFTKVLEIQRRVRGPNHPDTLSAMSDLALLYSYQKRYAESVALKLEALAGCRRVLGAEHPYTLKLMSNLAATYTDQRKYAEAEALNRETLALMSKTIGPAHPSTLIVMNNLGVALKCEGKYAEAEVVDQNALAAAGRTLGTNSSFALSSRSNLAMDWLFLRKYRQAETAFRELLQARRQQPGPEDAGTLRTAYNLAWAYYSEGKFADAESLLRQNLAIYDRKKRESWERARCQSLLEATLSAESKYAEAEPLLREGAEGLLQHESDILWYGATDPDRALQNLVRLYRDGGKVAQAAEWQHKLQERAASNR